MNILNKLTITVTMVLLMITFSVITTYEVINSQDSTVEIQMDDEIAKVNDTLVNQLRGTTDRLIDLQVELSNLEVRHNEFLIETYPQDVLDFARMVEAEATGGSFESKVNVANVILNRVRSDHFPDTVTDVIFQHNQFSPTMDGRFEKVTVTKSSVDAVYEAMTGKDTTDGALYFMLRSMSDEGAVTWFDDNLTFIFKDDLGHEFWK